MKFTELISARYSVRAYKPDPLPDNALNQILEAARLAPTAANHQPFQVIVIHTQGRQAELNRIYHREWFTQAPLILCMCGLAENGWVRAHDGANYTHVDTAIVMDHIVLAATDLGLGTCWVANFKPQVAREILQLPDNVEPVAFTPLGYAADAPQAKIRKPLTELVRYEKW